MPYLNWKTEKVACSFERSGSSTGALESRARVTLSLKLESRLCTALAGALKPVLLDGEGELRLDLPGGWVLFWKRREEESRLLVAHPQPGEYVGTLSLEPQHSEKLLLNLEKNQVSENLIVGALAPRLGAVSNFEVEIQWVTSL
jgi:hypothetical protein